MLLRQLVCPMVVAALVLVSCAASAAEQSQVADPTAPLGDSRLPTGRAIAPAGESLSFYGRPVDIEIGPQGRLLFVKDWKSLRMISANEFRLEQSIELPGGASLHGLAVDKSGHVYVTNAKNSLHVFSLVGQQGDAAPAKPRSYQLSHSIDLPADSYPCGIALSQDGAHAFVCLSIENTLAVVDLNERKLLASIPVGVAPYDVVLDESGATAIVSNLGGRRPTLDDQTAPSGNTETVVDNRGIASTGTVSIVDLANSEVVREISTGLHASALLRVAGANNVWVANGNNDTVTVLSSDLKSAKSFVVKPSEDLPFGSMPSALTMSPDGKQVFAALAGNNAVAVLEASHSGDDKKQRARGFVPTAWFPSALACNETHLFVANLKGTGSRSPRRPQEQGRNSHDHQATVQKIALARIGEPAQLRKWTTAVQRNSKIAEIRDAMRKRQIGADVSPVPIPENRGEPSVFNHVIYVIKENRTFDQVFGDFPEARSEKALCVFPRDITPNHHALAERFGILDNYYCNGVLSADGHSWATEGNVTPYLERAFGGFARSYTFGDDPITYSSSGFLWDHILAAGLSFRNYGEMDYASIPGKLGFLGVWKKYKAGEAIQFGQEIGVDRLRRYSCRDYPGWNMNIPDVLRIDRFLKEFRKFEQDGGLPNVCIVYLPQDHLGGDVISRAHMADNDLALGRLVEAVSRSRYWRDTLIVANEDDPQNGYDHIDGHRSICLVASAYSRPGVNHHFYNQTSVLRTILHIFGLPPMNQQDASAPLMTDCFTNEPNLEPFKALDANYALDEVPPPKAQQSSIEREWRRVLATVPIQRTGMKTERDEDNLNRFIWHDLRGWQTPYPEEWAGAHGRGLKQLGLKFSELTPDDD